MTKRRKRTPYPMLRVHPEFRRRVLDAAQSLSLLWDRPVSVREITLLLANDVPFANLAATPVAAPLSSGESAL